MSFGFIATEDEWEENTRYVNRAELFEISIVHNAAYGEETEAALRNRCNVPRPDLRRRYLRLRFGELNR
jgi:phage head maturation protease